MLKLHSLDEHDQLVFPENFSELTLQSPATDLITDFKVHRPFVMDGNLSIDEAEKIMHRGHIHLKIIIDESNELLGILDTEDLYTDDALTICAGRSRSDVSVRELMRARNSLRALDLQHLGHATVQDVVHALQHEGVRHCLVVDSEQHHIRGLIAASDIAARLRLNLAIQERPSFLDIFRVIQGQ